ncbi:MAG: heavy-metal-associated domain-containing protein [Rikenellaceae bacterium]
MKKIILMVIAMVMTVGISEVSAAKKEKKEASITTTQFVTNISCAHCEKKVMDYMPFQKGVKEVTVDLPKKIVTVSYDSSKSSNKDLIKRFSKISVTAQEFDPKNPTMIKGNACD